MMIEDALKNIRNVYRLILTVSFITLVFSLSISFPQDKKIRLTQIEKLIEFNFLEYVSFVDQSIDELFLPKLNKLSEDLKEKIEKQGLQIFNLHHIHEAFTKNSHVGKILIEELILGNTSNANLNQFNALNGLSLNKDVQVILPEVDKIAKAISLFLHENYKVGLRVDNVNLSIGNFPFSGASFLPNDKTLLNLYFVLAATIRTDGSPVFNVDFPAKVISLPDTSFEHWIIEKSKNMDIVKQQDGELVWLPTLNNLPNGFREQTLGLLAKNLKNDIKKTSPEEQKVSILGANMPGILLIYASPILLIALMYYLMNHSFHLLKLAKKNDNLIFFNQFSWMPLSLKKYWQIDLIGSIVLLPFLSLFILFIQLSRFGATKYLSIMLLVGTLIMIGLLARIILKNIRAIREAVEKETIEPNKTN